MQDNIQGVAGDLRIALPLIKATGGFVLSNLLFVIVTIGISSVL